MKLVSFDPGGGSRVGAVVHDDRFVVDLATAERRLARRQKRARYAFFNDMMGLLEAGGRGMAAARAALRLPLRQLGEKPRADGRITWELGSVRLLAPVPAPRKVFCLAGNYRDHIEEGGRAKLQRQDVETPRVFMKPPSTTVLVQSRLLTSVSTLT